jgi:putative MATE family efflux protein
LLAVVFAFLGYFLTPQLLKLMLRGEAQSSAIYPNAAAYLKIYFLGVAGLMFYNIGAGILRAIGDSFRPFLFLVASALTNIVLDIVFVFAFDMGVEGVALATVIAQLISSILTMTVLMRTSTCVRFHPKKMRLDGSILKKVFLIGFPAGLQMAITSFSNMFVQSYVVGVNGVPEYTLGGWTTYSKIDQFIFLPVQSISLAATTFVGQNLGKGDEKRAKKGTFTAFRLSLIATVILIAIIMIFAPQLARFFNSDENIVACATLLLHYITPFYMFCCVNQVFSAALRGAGRTTAPMFIMIGSFVVFRQIYLFVVSNFISNDLLPIAFSYPAGWGLCCVLTLFYYFRYGTRKTRVVATDEK